ncbi:MAG TPA: YHS domain-containing (seleno)protein [Pseudolabrys sp.]|nr:YHS domain-containing (seleno)protein [Pseudolabrys sp.]
MLFALGILLYAGLANPTWSAAPAPVVTDPQTGLAIDGFDPVAYFTGDGPLQGREQYEYRQAGTMWRFNSEANRAVFVDHPDVYAPQFGGYDPIAIGRGVSVPGNPLTWAVVADRLYLFYDAKARADFIEAPRRAIEAAQRQWPDVKRTLP